MSTDEKDDFSAHYKSTSSQSSDSLSPTEIDILTSQIREYNDTEETSLYDLDTQKGDDETLSDIERDGDMWDQEVINTINTWYKEVHRIQWIYTEAFSDMVKTSNLYSRGNVICSSITAALAFVASQGTDNIVNYIIVASSGISILLQGMKNLSVPDEKMRKYTEYLGKVKSFATIIKTEITIPIKYRRNGKKLILSLAQSYTDLNSTKPVISTMVYSKYLSKYNQFLNTLSSDRFLCGDTNIV